jgi:hypothetical protein
MKRQMHPHACFAAKAAICAQAQDKFWTFHDRLFRLGRSINRTSIRELATDVGLDKEKFEACLKAESTRERVQQDIKAAVALGVRGTPTFYMGGPLLERFQPPGISLEMFDELFKAVDRAKRDYEARRRESLQQGASPRPRRDSPARPSSEQRSSRTAPSRGSPSRAASSRGSPSRAASSRGSPSRAASSRGSPSRTIPSRAGSAGGSAAARAAVR